MDREVDGALPAKHQDNDKNKRKKNFKNQSKNGESSFNNNQKGKGGGSNKMFPPCQHYGKKGHPSFQNAREDLMLSALSSANFVIKQ